MKPYRSPRTAKAITLQIVAIMTAFFAGDRLLSLVADFAMSRSKAGLSMAYHSKLDHPIWILGNSRAIKSFQSGVLSEQTGREAINLGTNGIRPPMLHAMLADIIELNEAPEIVLIEISYLKNGWDDSQGAEFLPFVQRGGRTGELLRERLVKETHASDWFHLRRYGGQQFFRSLSYLSKDDQGAAPRRKMGEPAITALGKREPERFSLRREDVVQLRTLLEELEIAGIEVQLVLAPYLAEYHEKIVELNQWLEEVEKMLGRPIRNESRRITSAEFFSDHVHLNRDGQEPSTGHGIVPRT